MSKERLFWAIGLATTCICMVIAIPLCFTIIRNLNNAKSLASFTKIVASFTTALNALCISFYVVSLPICMNLTCINDFWAQFTYLTTMNTYILSKICLYSVFIGRLYNEFFKKIHAYSNRMLYCLAFMMLLALCALIMVNILMKFVNNHVYELNTAAIIVFVCLDFSLSVFTLSLFVVPLCSKYGHKIRLSIVKYIILSLIAIISSTVCGILMIFRYSNHWYYPFPAAHSSAEDEFEYEYIDLLNALKCIDCLISLFCIYFGFVAKETYTKYCGKCSKYCIYLFQNKWNNEELLEELSVMKLNGSPGFKAKENDTSPFSRPTKNAHFDPRSAVETVTITTTVVSTSD